ncbi:MAG: adenylosuccinate lyase [candidate division WOR-3 bacterium]
MIERYLTKEMAELWKEDKRFEYWLLVEKTVAEVQGEMGIIPKECAKEINKASFSLSEIKELEKETGHDVIAFLKSIENHLSDEKAKSYLHYGLTSYDIVDTAWALQLRDGIEIIINSLKKLKEIIKNLALKYENLVMMGRTHGIFAEPITFGLKLLSFYCEIDRNIVRLERAKEEISYGKISGAVGTYSTLNPEIEKEVLKRLNLKVEPVSTQIVPRDRYAYLITICAIVASSFERVATEIRNLQRSEIDEVSEPFLEKQKGSSAMPHKRNPILCERIVSLARYIRSLIFPALENISLWHERDLTNSANERIVFPHTLILLHYIIEKMIFIFSNLKINEDKMKENILKAKELYYSSLLLILLMKKGLKRSLAYDLVQRLSFLAMEKDRSFLEVIKEDKEIRKYLNEEELNKYFNLKYLLRNVKEIFKRVLKEEV